MKSQIQYSHKHQFYTHITVKGGEKEVFRDYCNPLYQYSEKFHAYIKTGTPKIEIPENQEIDVDCHSIYSDDLEHQLVCTLKMKDPICSKDRSAAEMLLMQRLQGGTKVQLNLKKYTQGYRTTPKYYMPLGIQRQHLCYMVVFNMNKNPIKQVLQASQVLEKAQEILQGPAEVDSYLLRMYDLLQLEDLASRDKELELIHAKKKEKLEQILSFPGQQLQQLCKELIFTIS